MMFAIGKTMRFAASHQIDTLPPEHKCSRLHGHNYTVEFILEANDLDEHGFVRDFGDLVAAEFEVERLDHRHLNDLLPTTSAEYLARHFYEACRVAIPQLIAVRVRETPTGWAEYRP